jgi:hypothetical protein
VDGGGEVVNLSSQPNVNATSLAILLPAMLGRTGIFSKILANAGPHFLMDLD